MSTELAGEGDRPEVDSTEDAIFGEAAEVASPDEGIRMERLDGFVITPDPTIKTSFFRKSIHQSYVLGVVDKTGHLGYYGSPTLFSPSSSFSKISFSIQN